MPFARCLPFARSWISEMVKIYSLFWIHLAFLHSVCITHTYQFHSFYYFVYFNANNCCWVLHLLWHRVETLRTPTWNQHLISLQLFYCRFAVHIFNWNESNRRCLLEIAKVIFFLFGSSICNQSGTNILFSAVLSLFFFISSALNLEI